MNNLTTQRELAKQLRISPQTLRYHREFLPAPERVGTNLVYRHDQAARVVAYFHEKTTTEYKSRIENRGLFNISAAARECGTTPARLHRLMNMGLVERPTIQAGKRMYYLASGLQRVRQQVVPRTPAR